MGDQERRVGEGEGGRKRGDKKGGGGRGTKKGMRERGSERSGKWKRGRERRGKKERKEKPSPQSLRFFLSVSCLLWYIYIMIDEGIDMIIAKIVDAHTLDDCRNQSNQKSGEPVILKQVSMLYV